MKKLVHPAHAFLCSSCFSKSGLMYMSIKHLVDRYNMYYIYTPSKISASIHSTAITFFQIAILMMLSQMSTFITLRTGSSIMSTTSLMVLFVAGIIFFGQCFCHCCWNIGVTIVSFRSKQQCLRTTLFANLDCFFSLFHPSSRSPRKRFRSNETFVLAPIWLLFFTILIWTESTTKASLGKLRLEACRENQADVSAIFSLNY